MKTTTDARQGETRGNMRLVLVLSVALIIAVYGALYGYTALFTAHQ